MGAGPGLLVVVGDDAFFVVSVPDVTVFEAVGKLEEVVVSLPVGFSSAGLTQETLRGFGMLVERSQTRYALQCSSTYSSDAPTFN